MWEGCMWEGCMWEGCMCEDACARMHVGGVHVGGVHVGGVHDCREDEPADVGGASACKVVRGCILHGSPRMHLACGEACALRQGPLK